MFKKKTRKIRKKNKRNTSIPRIDIQKTIKEFHDLQNKRINKNILYIVQMLRFGNEDDHIYIEGIYDNYKKAQFNAFIEKMYRGGNKYYPKIIKAKLNTNISGRTKRETSDILKSWKNEKIIEYIKSNIKLNGNKND